MICLQNYLLVVRPDTLSDMVAHMTKSVGLVHQMPFSCDRTGLPATLEKVRHFSMIHILTDYPTVWQTLDL